MIPTINISEHLFSNYLQQQKILIARPHSFLAFAQSLRPEIVSQKVYQAIPNFPKENFYVNKETQVVDSDNTLIARLVRYHQYIKTRPTIFRLDWKLTLADYMGKNEIFKEDRYPGYSTLTESPLEKDRQAISSLTAEQRDELVNLLVSIYNPNYQNNAEQLPRQDNPSLRNENISPSFQLPQPGGADLLLP
jgi:hypothetical protein